MIKSLDRTEPMDQKFFPAQFLGKHFCLAGNFGGCFLDFRNGFFGDGDKLLAIYVNTVNFTEQLIWAEKSNAIFYYNLRKNNLRTLKFLPDFRYSSTKT